MARAHEHMCVSMHTVHSCSAAAVATAPHKPLTRSVCKPQPPRSKAVGVHSSRNSPHRVTMPWDDGRECNHTVRPRCIRQAGIIE
jgi:hypothetical protein